MQRREWLFAFVVSGVHGVDHLLKRVFPPLIPIWAAAFGYPLWKLGLILGAHTFGSALGQAPMGILSDRYDRRYLLSVGIGVMGVGVLILATIPAITPLGLSFSVLGYGVDSRLVTMLAAMLVAGLGSSTVHPTGYPLITVNVDAANKGRVLGMWGSASKFGDGLAPAAVGVLLVFVPWTVVLGLFGALAVAFTAALFVVLRAFETEPVDVDPETSAKPQSDDDGRAYRYPMIVIFVYFTVQIMAANGVTVFLPEFVTSIYGFTVSAFGTTLEPESTASFYYSSLLIVAGLAQLGTGVLADRFDHRKIVIGYLLVATVALTALSTLALSPVGLVVVLVVLGASLFSQNPARDALVSDITPPEREGRTFGYLWTGALVAASISPPIIGYIGEILSLRVAFAMLAGVVLLSAVPIALLLNERIYSERAPTVADTD
ncbi:MFS transporter [Halorussus halophilus]|uniref:MFS transporter n=1 Tax=Halorussus halophilus TaxID=2650975 RepID=UPI0013017B1C|nr:MFS transporter [Halorussus halophilus]